MNFLLPLLVGGPDMANWKDPLVRKHTYNSNSNSNSKIKFIGIRYYSTSTNHRYINDNKKDKNNKTKEKTVFQRILIIFKDLCIGGFKGIIKIGMFYLNHLTLICLIILLSIITYIFIHYNVIITNTLESILITIICFLFTLSWILFYLDGLEFSNIKLLKYMQIFTFICTPFIIIVLAYNHVSTSTDIISYIKDGDNNIHLHGHISVDKETGKAIGQGVGQGLSIIGTQLGLGATMATTATAVSTAIAKSGMPPLQKAGVIVAASIATSFGHSIISSANRDAVRAENTATSVSSANIGSNINKLVDDSHISPLQELLFSSEMMTYVCLSLVYILIIQLVFKLYIKDNISLNLSKFFGNKYNAKLEFYFNKIIKLNKQMSLVWIWFIFIIWISEAVIEAYSLHKLLINLDNFIEGYISFNPDFSKNIVYIPEKSLNNILFNLNIVNYISIFTLGFLILQVVLKLHYNKDISHVYIWLALSVFVLSLGFAAYTYGDLYTHINSYVNMYINLRNK